MESTVSASNILSFASRGKIHILLLVHHRQCCIQALASRKKHNQMYCKLKLGKDRMQQQKNTLLSVLVDHWMVLAINIFSHPIDL